MKRNLSYRQKHLFSLQQFEKEKKGSDALYSNTPLIIRIQGAVVNSDIFKIVTNVIQDFDILNCYMNSTSLMYNEFDSTKIKGWKEVKKSFQNLEEAIDEIIKESFVHIELNSEDTPFNIYLLEWNERDFLLCLTFHSIIVDRYSLHKIYLQFVEHLQCSIKGNSSTPKLIQYDIYAQWYESLPEDILEDQRFHWMSKLPEEVPFWEFPKGKVVQTRQYIPEAYSFCIEKSLTNRISVYANHNRISYFSIFATIVSHLLQKYTNESKIIIGTDAIRQHEDFYNIVGPLSNIVAIVTDIKPDSSTKKSIEDIEKEYVQSQRNQLYPIEKLISELGYNEPLFNVTLNVDLTETPSSSIGDIVCSLVESNYGYGDYDLNITFKKCDDLFNGTITYNSSKIHHDVIKNFVEHYIQLLNGFVSNPDAKICNLNYNTKSLFEVLPDSSDIALGNISETLISKWNEQVVQKPDKQAVRYKQKDLTYLELDQLSTAISMSLISECNVERGDFVAVLMPNSEKLIASILGVLKSGAAYIPIDPKIPNERIQYIIKDAGCRAVLVDEKTITWKNDSQEVKVLDVDDIRPQSMLGYKLPTTKSHDNAYVIYTSGTTGKPKGCLVSHKNVVSLLYSLKKELDIKTNDVWVLAHSHSFDFSIAEIFGALAFGGKLIIPDNEVSNDVNHIYEIVTENRVSILTQTPMSFDMFIEVNCQNHIYELDKHLRIVLLGGEKLEFGALQKWVNIYSTDTIKIINGYGPTETTVFATFFTLDDFSIEHSKSSMIGKALPDMYVYVLDDNLNELPIGHSGELYIGGNGVTSGYLNTPQITNERFLTNNTKNSEVRLYKTGDVVKRHADGNIEYIGRKDNQVKVNGYRIELEEIEVHLKNIENIKDGIVDVLTGNGGNTYIVAYYISNEVFAEQKLKEQLEAVLPIYMIPSRFEKLDFIPLTNNGKKDKKSLPFIPLYVEESGRTIPTKAIDVELVGAFKEVLKIKDHTLYVESDFFSIGGNSLSAVMLMLKLETLFDVKLTLEDLFDNSSVEKLASIITTKLHLSSTKKVMPLIKAPSALYYPTSSSQERMYVLQQLTPNDTFYNVTQVIELQGEVNIEVIKNVIMKLVMRHDILRTSFDLVDDTPVQIIHENVVVDVAKYNIDKDINTLTKPFVLSEAPLFRVAYIEHSNSLDVAFDMHHIITDYLSQEILINEFTALLAGDKLDSLKFQYKDYAVWQRDGIRSNGNFLKKESYWLDKYNDGVQRIELPFDSLEKGTISYEGKEHSVLLPNEMSDLVRLLAREEGVTLYMFFLACFNIFLAKLSGEKIIKVGTPVLGRNHSEALGILGFFANTVILRNTILGSESFESILNKVKEECISSIDNQDYPYELLVDKVGASNEVGSNPLFNVMYTFKESIGSTDTESLKKLNENGISILKKDYIKSKSLFDLSLHVTDTEEGFLLSFEYKTSLFKEKTIEQFGYYIQNIIDQVVNKISINVSEVQLMDQVAIDKYLSLSKGKEIQFRKGTFLSLFESIVVARPASIAICQDGCEYSYQDINNKANQLGRHLIDVYNIKKGDFIALLHDRTPNVIIGILAILKSGAAYVPIDPSFPVERINTILVDANTKGVITQSKYCEMLQHSATTIVLEDCINEHKIVSNLDIEVSLKMPIYTIYTSGSTGKPKGVVVSNESLYNYISWLRDLFPDTAFRSVLACSTLSFDMSISEIFYPLAFGGTVYLIDSLLDTERLQNISQEITFMVSVPSVVSSLLEYINDFESLNVLGLGGEPIDLPVLKKIRRYTSATVYNLYGPTEATVAPAYFNCNTVEDWETEVSIGLPIANSKILVLDDSMNVQPPNVKGELYIGGIALAKGYLNNPVLTREKFVLDPYDKNKVLYRTGDYGYYKSSGELYYNGRIDEQIKIRGYRVEVNEVVVSIKSIEGISNAVVLVKEEKSRMKYLCAYFTGDVAVEDVRYKLQQYLPNYMVPTEIYKVDSIPIKRNGKVDTLQLLNIEGVKEVSEGASSEYSETAQMLKNVLENYLPNSSVGMSTSFFEMGLNSLMLLNVVNTISKDYNIDIPPVRFFKYPTINQLSNNLTDSDSENDDDDDVFDADSKLLSNSVKLFEDGEE